jgi:hypothetical protein
MGLNLGKAHRGGMASGLPQKVHKQKTAITLPMPVCQTCGNEFTIDYRTSLSRGFLKLTSLRRPWLRLAVGFLLSGIVGIIVFLTETHDILPQAVLLAILAIIVLLVLDILFCYVNQLRNVSRFCPDCRAEEHRLQRTEETGPHKVTVEKNKRA